MQRKDPLTGELFSPTRNNQLFATRKNQIRFNNNKANQKRQQKSIIDKILDNNRNILIRLLSSKKEIKLSKDYLLGAGFNFGCISHNRNIEGTIWTCIYEYGYLKTSTNEYRIIKHS